MKRCPQCKQLCYDDRVACPHCDFSFRAERSGVLQGCPPSASGSAREIAAKEERAQPATASDSKQLADSSDRSAREAILERVLLWRIKADVLRRCARENAEDGHCPNETGAMLGAAKQWDECASEIESILATGAPPAAGERALARNEKINDGGECV